MAQMAQDKQAEEGEDRTESDDGKDPKRKKVNPKPRED